MKNKKNAFTLVELLAVIVILAVILVIAVPQVLDVIESSKKGSIESTVKLIANTAEKKYAEMLISGEAVTGTLNCSEVVELSTSDYTNCTVSFDDEGKASVTVTGIGKFEGYTCTNGTKENANCTKGEVSSTNNMVSYIENLYNTAATENGLVKDDTDDENIRYAGSNDVVKNYVSFDGDVWRIIGIVDGKIKLVKEESLGDYSWDSSASDMNSGLGYNIWETIEGQTKADGTTKADLNILLNEGYYGGSYPSTCYGGNSNTTTECPTTYINPTLKTMVDENAVWYLGSHLGGQSIASVQPKEMYGYERGTTIYWADIAKTEWTGPVGLIYPSDYGYAADRTKCTETLRYYNNTICTNNNWLYKNSVYWTLSPASSHSNVVFYVVGSGGVFDNTAYGARGIVPAVYLKSNILIESGDGSSSNPYILKAS